MPEKKEKAISIGYMGGGGYWGSLGWGGYISAMAVLMDSWSLDPWYLCSAFLCRFARYSSMGGTLSRWCSGSLGSLYGAQIMVLRHLFWMIWSFFMYFGTCIPRWYPVSMIGLMRVR